MRHDPSPTIDSVRTGGSRPSSIRSDRIERRRAAAVGRRARLLAALLIPFTMLAGTAARADDGPLRVCTTTPDLAALTREVGGDAVEVTAFVKPTEDPHFAEAKPSYVRALHEADLFIQIGLDLERGYAPLLQQQARNAKILQGTPGFLDASTAIGRALDVPTGTVDRSMGDVHAGGNPHYLLDPMRGLAVARLIATRLGELRPDVKSSFDARYDDFQRRTYIALVGAPLAEKYGPDVPKLALLYQHGKLASFLDGQGQSAQLGGWLGALLPYAGAKVVDDHPIWTYFAETFRLTVVGHLEPMPGVPPTTKHLEEVIGLMRTQEVRIVLASAYYDPRYAQFVGEKTGAKVLRMANQVGAVPAASSYVDMISYDVDQVVSALKTEAR